MNATLDVTAPTENEPMAEEKNMREYVVLERSAEIPGERAWVEIGRSFSRDDMAAIKAVLAERATERDSGAYIAVPRRSWRERVRVVETRKQETWS